MERVRLADLYELASWRNSHCVSITLPTHPIGREGQHDAMRFKNLLSATEQRLVDRGVRTPQIRKLVDPLADLPHDRMFWSGRKHGLAVFRSDKVLEIYRVSTALEESLVLDRRFHIKRLLSALDLHPPLFVLVLGRQRVRFLRGVWQGCEPIALRDVPMEMEHALHLQTADRQEEMQLGSCGDFGDSAAVFHQQGDHRGLPKEEITEYFGRVMAAVEHVLHDAPWPLFLAGVDEHTAAFRAVASHLHIERQTLAGNFECARDEVVHEHALPLARRCYARLKSKALDTLVDYAHTDRASYDLEKVVPAAFQGQVETLIVNPLAAEFGRFHPETNWVEFTGDRSPPQDLVEGAIEQTILHRGTVYAALPAELPDGCAMGAVFRF